MDTARTNPKNNYLGATVFRSIDILRMNGSPNRARSWVCTSLFVAISCFTSSAHAAFIQSQIRPGEKLVVTFAFASPPTSSFGAVDFIQFGGGISYTDFWTGGRSSSVTINIYDGNSLLGTKSMASIVDSACGCIFVSPGSPGSTTATVDMDMSSIVDGTIDGRIEFVPVFDSPSDASLIDFNWQLKTGHYFGYGSFAFAAPDPTILANAVVPIPPAVGLFASALGVMGWLRRRVST